MAEWIGCPVGLNESIQRARCFYAVLAMSVIVGMTIALLPINPIAAILYSQVLTGFLTPILLVLIMLIARNKEIMGPSNVNTWAFNVLGWMAVGIMTLADVTVVWMLLS